MKTKKEKEKQKQKFIQLHNFTDEEQKRFHKYYNPNKPLVINDDVSVTVVKRPSIDIIHIWKLSEIELDEERLRREKNLSLIAEEIKK